MTFEQKSFSKKPFVKKDCAKRKKKLGWELFTDYVIKTLNLKDEPVEGWIMSYHLA